MKNDNTIKPCPFCDSENLIIAHSTEDREGFPSNIVCEDCGASGPWAYIKDKKDSQNLQYVVRKTYWNTRGK